MLSPAGLAPTEEIKRTSQPGVWQTTLGGMLVGHTKPPVPPVVVADERPPVEPLLATELPDVPVVVPVTEPPDVPELASVPALPPPVVRAPVEMAEAFTEVPEPVAVGLADEQPIPARQPSARARAPDCRITRAI